MGKAEQETAWNPPSQVHECHRLVKASASPEPSLRGNLGNAILNVQPLQTKEDGLGG